MGTEWLAELGDEDRRQAITSAFSKVLATGDGQVVFRMIFEAGGVFAPALNETLTARRNFCLEIIHEWMPGAEARMYAALLHQEK